MKRFNPQQNDLLSSLGESRIYFVPVDTAGNPLRPLPTLDAFEDWWILLCDTECQLNPRLPELLHRYVADRPDIGIFYGDEAVAGTDAADRRQQILKSDFDQTQLQATDYIGWPLFVKSRVLETIAPTCNPASGAFSYDLLLRAVAAGYTVGRIPHVLSARDGPLLRAEAVSQRAVLRLWTHQNQPDFEVAPGRIEGLSRLMRRFDPHPEVTIIVPTRQALSASSNPKETASPYIINFLNSLIRSSWPADKLSVIIGDDIADGSAYDGGDWPFKINRYSTSCLVHNSFNYARKMNELWQICETEHIIMMNDDLVVRNADWIESLLTFSMQEDVGGAGARLLYPDNTIQHAGMAGGPMGGCTHVFIGTPAGAPTYLDWADMHREWSMVTGAAFATRRSILERIGGFDERFSLEFNDIDMCMRMRMLGYRIVYTPHAELTHFESASRTSLKRPGSEVMLFLQRWRELLSDDPAYHPRLSRRTSNPSDIDHDPPFWFRAS